jgi:hypothetical protein
MSVFIYTTMFAAGADAPPRHYNRLDCPVLTRTAQLTHIPIRCNNLSVVYAMPSLGHVR